MFPSSDPANTLKAVVSSVPIILIALDRDGVFTLTEGGGLAVIERGDRSVIGRRIDEVYGDVPAIVRAAERALAGETASTTVTVDDRVYDIHYTPTHDATGAVSGVVGLALDVTARHQSEESYRSLFDGASEGIFRAGLDGRILLANTALAELLGYASPAELIAQVPDLAEALAFDPVRRHELLDRLRTAGQVTAFEIAGQRRDGKRFWVTLNARVLCDAADRPLGVAGRLEDITARRLAETALAESEERYRVTVAALSEGVVRQEIDGRITACNAAAEQILGLTADQFAGRVPIDPRWHVVDTAGNPAPEAAHPRMRAFATGKPQREMTVGIHKPDGTMTWVVVNATPLLHPDTMQPYAVVTSFTDITARQATETALHLSEERFRSAFDDAAIGMALVAPTGRFLRVNQALCDLLGYTQAELLATDFQALTHPDDLASDEAQMAALLHGAVTGYQLEKRYLRRDGRVVWALLSVSLVRDVDGTPLHFLSQIQDIDARKLAEEQLRHQALHDILTGLPNRILFLDRLNGALARRIRREERLGVCFIDLDGFKVVNDQFGHAAGDVLLATIAERLRQVVRTEDTVARFGGDEFIVLLEGGLSEPDAERLARRLIAAIERPVALGEWVAHVSASLGIALSPPTGDSAEVLLAAADAAMYTAKLRGKGCWVLAQREAVADEGDTMAAGGGETG